MTSELINLRMNRHFDASREQVFDAWINPKIACHWLFTSPASETNDTRMDACIGGKWSIMDRRGGTDYRGQGEYIEIDRPRRLVFTFGMPQFSPEVTRVIVEIAADGDGCVLTLTQEGVSAPDEKGLEEGWNDMFDNLAPVLDPNRAYGVIVEPGTIRFERLLPGPVERVWAYLTDSDKRGKWLAWGEMQPRVGSQFELRFHHSELSTNKAPIPEKWRPIESGHVSRHHIVRFEPPHFLSFSWGNGAGGDSEVAFELTPRGDKVLLILTHRRLADRAAMVGTAGGWNSHLRMLTDRLEGREPPAFWAVHADVDGLYDRRFPSE
ncbi:MAG: hypothetical protein JWM91_1868 [Rhodospirillales bacterium]|nr:hypothetical protein [Rhodospirillales bacterium]